MYSLTSYAGLRWRSPRGQLTWPKLTPPVKAARLLTVGVYDLLMQETRSGRRAQVDKLRLVLLMDKELLSGAHWLRWLCDVKVHLSSFGPSTVAPSTVTTLNGWRLLSLLRRRRRRSRSCGRRLLDWTQWGVFFHAGEERALEDREI